MEVYKDLYIMITKSMCQVIHVEISDPAVFMTVGSSLYKQVETTSLNIVPTYEA